MIKVLEEPQPFTIVCKKCGCKFQYDYEDLEIPVTNTFKIKCPRCQEENLHIVPGNETPGIPNDKLPILNDPTYPGFSQPIPAPIIPPFYYNSYDPLDPFRLTTSTPVVPCSYQTTCKNEVINNESK